MAENAQVTSFGATTADYSTDVLTAKAVDFIAQAHGQPFLLHIGYFSPHGDTGILPIPADRHRGAFATVSPWRPPHYDEDDMTDKPPWVAARPRANDIIPGSYVTYGGWTDAERRIQLETLLAVDEGIEALVTALEDSGQAENTIIVFTSDNGYQWWEHRYSSKGPPYEENIRVPLLVRFPRLELAPREEPRLALTIDLAPTLACLAGVSPPGNVDGRCLEPVLRGGVTPWRSDFLIEFWDLNGVGTLPSYAGVRSETWKYVTYEEGEMELYDLDNDPYELDNRAYDSSYQDVVSSLQFRLDELLP
jgi:arylsulfatase A-like enzyme